MVRKKHKHDPRKALTMKTIKLIEDVEIDIAAEDDVPIEIDGKMVSQKSDDTCSMKRFLKSCIYAYVPFGKGLKNIRIGNRLIEAIKAADEKLEIEDGDYRLLKKAMEEMENPPGGAFKFLPFYEAFDKAK